MKISVYLTSTAKGNQDSKLRQVCFRVREGVADLLTRTSLLADPDYWDETITGYRHTSKMTAWEVKELNKKIEDISVLIHERYTEDCDGSWLRNLVKDYLNSGTVLSMGAEVQPTLEQMCRFNESRKVCKGRLCCMRGTLKKPNIFMEMP